MVLALVVPPSDATAGQVAGGQRCSYDNAVIIVLAGSTCR